MAQSTVVSEKKILTLCFAIRDGRVLLGMKKRGFGAGRWNGFGGKLEPGESVEAAARRELREEAGIEAEALVPRGTLSFAYEHVGKEMEVRVFEVSRWSGEPVETEEMRPRWFALADFPYAEAWPDDRHWMPYFLAGRNFRGRFVFSDYDTIASHELQLLD
jgi:8-oxo-dGTP diphosphatase/2-hydroxy-dATP diphosphatase